jgi:hypothetical protein
MNQHGTFLVMKPVRQSRSHDQAVARTIRFPKTLRERISADAERCNRSFESQVIAVLRRHYGEDVDIAPQADAILELARASLFGVPDNDQARITRKLSEDEA